MVLNLFARHLKFLFLSNLLCGNRYRTVPVAVNTEDPDLEKWYGSKRTRIRNTEL